MPQRRAQRRALIIGGSMSGLLAALMLKQNGWQVEVFERAESGLAGRGAGIVAQPEMIARLAGLGLDTHDIGVPVTARKIFDREGKLVASGVCPQVLTAWERVYHMLRGAFPDAIIISGAALELFSRMPRASLLILPTAARSARIYSSVRMVFGQTCVSNFCR